MSRIKPNRAFSAESCIAAAPDEKAEIIYNVIQTNLQFRQLGQTRPKNTEELIERINKFFELCTDFKTLPTVEKLCLSIGFSRQMIWDWITGRYNCTIIRQSPGTPTVPEILESAKDFISSSDADLVSTGKMPVVSYIFRAKNFYSMSDKQEIAVEPKDNIRQDLSMDEIVASMPVPELPEIE